MRRVHLLLALEPNSHRSQTTTFSVTVGKGNGRKKRESDGGRKLYSVRKVAFPAKAYINCVPIGAIDAERGFSTTLANDLQEVQWLGPSFGLVKRPIFLFINEY